MKLRFLRRAGAMLLALTLACSLLTVPASATVTGVSLRETSLSLNSGDTGDLHCDIQADPGDTYTVVWESNNQAVATVDQNGKVTAVSAGSATITAKVDGLSASCTVTVTDPTPITVPVTGISLSPSPLTLDVGDRDDLNVLFQPANASNKNFTITNNTNPGVVSVTRSGGTLLRVTALSAGSSRITVTSEDGNHTADCVVTV